MEFLCPNCLRIVQMPIYRNGCKCRKCNVRMVMQHRVMTPRGTKRVTAACKQYGYDHGCIVPGCYGQPRLHHMVPKRVGGTYALKNMIAICEHHETLIHQSSLLLNGKPHLRNLVPDKVGSA